MKPGTLCYVVGLTATPDWNGRVVTAVECLGRVQAGISLWRNKTINEAWRIEAPWLPPVPCDPAGRWVLPRGNLQPIHDPDAGIPVLTEVTEVTDPFNVDAGVPEKALDPA